MMTDRCVRHQRPGCAPTIRDLGRARARWSSRKST